MALLSFGASRIDASGWPGYAANAALADAWLASLVQRGLLLAGDAPAAAPALAISARDQGSEGNTITIALSNVMPAPAPGDTTLDAVVNVTQAYPGLTTATLVARLGATPTSGDRPGLATVKSGSVALPAAGAGDFAGTPTATWGPSRQDGAAGAAFTLNARNNDDPDGVLPRGAVTDVDPVNGMFTLTLSWTKSAHGLKLSALGTTFGYVLVINAPPSGFAPPAAGLVTLIGGADATSSSATAAKATVLAA